MWFSLTPKEKTSTYFCFQDTIEQRCQLATNALPAVCLGALGEGRGQREGQPVLFLSVLLALLSVTLQGSRGPDGL